MFTGIIHYNITYGGTLSTAGSGQDSVQCVVDLLDRNGNYAVRKNRNFVNNGLSGTIEVPNARLWWPYLMNEEVGYLYTLQVSTMYGLDMAFEYNNIEYLLFNILSWNIYNEDVFSAIQNHNEE